MSELRWDPIQREWVITATHRQDRTYKPPRDFCPLCPTEPGGYPTEVPENYEIVVFQNKFPSLQPNPPEPAVEGTALHPVDLAKGVCEVVLYSSEHDSSLTEMSVEHITNLIKVWTDRYEELGSREEIKYVFIFENKGDAIGVTLQHPHGQIYAFPFIPPKVGRELNSSKEYMEETGKCLHCDVLGEELADGRRIVAENQDFVAFIPFTARYPYEIHIYARDHRRSLLEFNEEEQRSLARILTLVISKYDNLFGFSLPYMMIMHQAPTDGQENNHAHFHIEFYPPNRTETKLKYLAGCESGAGTFINDTLPEQSAERLRNTPPASFEEID